MDSLTLYAKNFSLKTATQIGDIEIVNNKGTVFSLGVASSSDPTACKPDKVILPNTNCSFILKYNLVGLPDSPTIYKAKVSIKYTPPDLEISTDDEIECQDEADKYCEGGPVKTLSSSPCLAD